MMSKSKLAFICVNYNTDESTKKMCVSLENQKNDALEVDVLIIDNSPIASADLESYCKSRKNVHYIRSDANDGYFAGLNLGLKSIDSSIYKYVVVGNNDLEYHNDFCLKLLDTKINERVQVICPDVITYDGVHQNPHHENALTRKEIYAFDVYFLNYYLAIVVLKLKKFIKFFKRGRGSIAKNFVENKEINQGVGACYILTINFFNQHSELYFPYFLYGEEALLSWQVRNSGGILVYNNKLKVSHAESATCSKIPAKIAYEYARTAYWGYRTKL